MEIQEQETETLDMNQPQDVVESVESKDPIADFIEKVDKEDGQEKVESEVKAEGLAGEEKAEQGEGTQAEENAGGEIEGSEKIEAEAPKFEPELQYSFRGKKFDMPEELKGLIDSPEKQEFYVDLFTKAKGLEIVKAEGLKAQESYQALSQDVNQFLEKTELKDYKAAFEKVGLPKPTLQDLVRGFGYSDQELIKLAYEKATLSPDQLQAQNELSERDRKIQELEMRFQRTEQQREQQLMSETQNEFQQVFQDPKVTAIVEAYDSKYGAGAFLNECLMRGEQIYQTEKRFIRPTPLVNEFIERYNLGSLVGDQPIQNQTQQNPSQQAPLKKQTNREIPVIPAIDGSGDSPGERVVRTLDDIKAIYQSEYGGEVN
jgi:hypothetical protein